MTQRHFDREQARRHRDVLLAVVRGTAQLTYNEAERKAAVVFFEGDVGALHWQVLEEEIELRDVLKAIRTVRSKNLLQTKG